MKHPKLLFLFFFLSFIVGIVNVQAFSLEKHLVQLEADANYPCHIEETDTIVCPALDTGKIEAWKNTITELKPEEKNKGKLADANKINYLDEAITLYSGKTDKTIAINKEYREKVDIYNLNKNIEIGFATNVFGVSGTPLENFDINTTTGMVRYRPLNDTWLNFSGTNRWLSFSGGLGGGSLETSLKTNFTYSFWVKATDSQVVPSWNFMNIIGYSGRSIVGFDNVTGNVSFSDYLPTGRLNNTLISNKSINDSKWHHVVAVRDNCNRTIYVDNILVANNGTMCSANTNTQMNSICDGISYYFAGQVDELRAYNNSLNPSQISEIYLSGRIANLSLPSDGLLLWLPFNEINSPLNYKNVYNWHDYLGSISLTNNVGGYPKWQSDNINVTTLGYEVNISIVNITNAWIYWDNGTDINPIDINGNGNFTGNKTFTYLNNQTIWIKENYLNSVPPVLTIISPLNGARYGTVDNLIVNFSATDDYLIDSLYYSIDGGITNTTYTSPVTLISKPSLITFYAKDGSGNLASSTSSLIYFSGNTNFCNNVTSGYGNFFSGIIAVFGILGIGIIILFLFIVVKATNGETIDVSNINTDIFEDFPVKAVFWSIMVIALIAWTTISLFGVLC